MYHSLRELAQRKTTYFKSGDLLYIPPFWVCYGSYVGTSISLGTCSASPAEQYIELLELLPLPFDLAWALEERIYPYCYLLALLS